MGLRIGETLENGNGFLIQPVVAESVFDNQDATKLLEILNNESLPKKKCIIPGIADNSSDAKFTISFIPYVDENAWVYGKIYDLALEANEQTYNFDNINMFEHIVYMEFNEGDFVNQHLDIGNEFPHNTRKITAIINLNNSDDYRGGEFKIHSSELITASRSFGDCVFFPSYLQNELTQVQSGTRKILVAWFGGESYK